MKALFNQSVSKIDTESPAVISSRLTENSNTIESGISQHFSLAIQAISFTIGLFVISFLKSIQLTFVALASVPIVIIAFAIALPLMYTISHESNAIRAQASSLAYESFQSIRIVTAFGAGGKLGDKHRKILDKARLVDHRLGPVMSGIMAPMFFTIYAIFALTFWRGIKLYSQGKIDNIGSIIVYVPKTLHIGNILLTI
jgi:ATP-binding cassette subfamily B (MDR/TAP) protein 1